MDGQKCEHEQCSCYVDLGQTYCSDRCREMNLTEDDAPPESKCGCRHPDCTHDR